MFIESLPHLNLPASHFDMLLPRDARALLYLVAANPQGAEAPPVEDRSAGRPEGQPLWRFATPQGFLMEFESAGVVQVVQVPECKRYPGVNLAAVGPDRGAFPLLGGEVTY